MYNCVEIKESPVHGKGVFATRNIEKGETLAVSHVTLLHHNEELPELIATLEFPWNEEYYALCLSDVGSFFNHNKHFSAHVAHQDKEGLTQTFKAVRDIAQGEEVTIYYNDDFQRFIQS